MIVAATGSRHGMVIRMTTQAGVGLSRQADSRQAGQEAARLALQQAGVERADWALLFATTTAHRPHFADLLSSVQESLGTQTLSGCSAFGVLTGHEEAEGEAAVAVLAVRSTSLTAEPLIGPAGDDRGIAAAREIGRRVADRGGLLLLMPDPFSLRPDAIVDAIDRAAPGIPAIGAAASSDPMMDRTFQFFGRNVATRSLAALHLSGRIHTSVGITQGCQPLGEPCRVTRGTGNLILELDGRPALETLRLRLPSALRDQVGQLSGHLFVAVSPEAGATSIKPGEYLVRHLLGVDAERGALAVGTEVRDGQPLLLVLREADAAREDLKQMLDRLAAREAARNAVFGFYFNCAARGSSLYGLSGIDTAYISRSFGDLPIVGFFGNAEIAPLHGTSRLFTYTGVLALVTEEA
jgi:small ligand-binding sensory domain FIST